MVVNFFLYRRFFAEAYTIGKLFLAEEYLCDTLEDKTRDLNKDGDLEDPGEGKIFGETAIPFGRYRMIATWSPKFRRILPEVLLVKQFTSIRIHAGNTIKDTLGCILVGDNKVKGGLINSRAAEIKIVLMLKGLLERGNEVWLNIV